MRVKTLGGILEAHLPASEEFTFLSVDVEGMDLAVLESNDWSRFRPEVIVAWQSLIVGLFTVPFALPVWQAPSLWQWVVMLAGGGIGSLGQYCSTRAMGTADFYAWADGNPSIALLDSRLAHRASYLAAMPHFCAINAALQVDLRHVAGDHRLRAEAASLLMEHYLLVEGNR